MLGIGAMGRNTFFAAVAALLLPVAGGGMLALTGYSNPVCAADTQLSFKDDVFPIFRGWCLECHQPGGVGYEKSGLDLHTYEGVMKGTKYGPMVIPGDPDTSNLMRLLDWKASPELRMPHGKKKLSTCDRDAIRAWIRQGAKNN
jgi:mono/diheme cytochrome c family protein